MAEVFRRRAMLKEEDEPIPVISFPTAGGTPFSSVCSTVAPNHLYVGSQNWNAAYYDCRSGSRKSSAPTNATPWFEIPANASCEIWIRNFAANPSDTSGAKNVTLYLVDTSNKNVKTVSTGSQTVSKLPLSFSGEFTTGDTAVPIGMIYVRGWSASKNFSLDVELYVNGRRWL